MCAGCPYSGGGAAPVTPAVTAAASRWGVTAIPSPTGVGTVAVPIYRPQALPGVTVTASPDRLPWWLVLAAVAAALVLVGEK